MREFLQSTPLDPETAAVVAAVATDKNFSNHMAFTHQFDHLRHEQKPQETITAMFDRHVAEHQAAVQSFHAEADQAAAAGEADTSTPQPVAISRGQRPEVQAELENLNVWI